MGASITSEPQPPCPRCGYLAEGAAGTANFCPRCGTELRSDPTSDDPTRPNPLAGQVIADRYKLIHLLGEGGMGSVYKAEHIRMGKALALKLLRGDFAREPGAVARFRAEAQIVSRLSHPHTIAVFDFGEIGEGDGFYLAMEYVPGKDLATVLREEGRLPEARAAEIGQQILGSLAEAHDAGIVHRDMKPGNVMIMPTRSGEDFVKVLDFGIAKLRDEASAPGAGGPASATHTSAGAIVGTPNYLSPEQARGDAPDARADLYSVGCVLYELVAGRPPFVSPTPMAVVQAHLSQQAPPLEELAPGISERYAEVVRRALAKKAKDRFASADDMRDALLALDEPTAPIRPRAAGEEEAVHEFTSGLEIANRDDFRDFERQLRSIRRGRVVAPLLVAGLVALLGGAVWRWDDVYALLARRAPRLSAALPAAFRPADLYDGEEHEPNDSPAQANPLPIPPGADGRAAGGVAVIRGHVGAKISETTGDVDVYRIRVPPGGRRTVLVAEWTGERPGEGIKGLDVALTLNRQRADDDARASAPLVANVDRGGPGRPETLSAGVEPGATYFLAVRERHRDETGPVEKPTDWYRLEVRLAEPRPGDEVEPNDAPDDVEHRNFRYPEWRALAERNPLGEGTVVHAATSPEDPDTYAVAPRRSGETTEWIAAAPDAGLALTGQLWTPDEVDLAPPRPKDRVRFERAGQGAAGEVLFLRLPQPPRPGAPALLQLRAASGEGRYDVVALGRGNASGPAAAALVEALAAAGRVPQALELAAGFVANLPDAPGRVDVLLAAGKAAERAAAALRPADLARFARTAQVLGDPLYEAAGAEVRYRGAFERAAAGPGAGRIGEEAAFRLVPLASPCTPEAIAQRATSFLQAHPASEHAGDARLWQAQAFEEAYWRGGGRDRRLLERALASYRVVAQGKGAAAAQAAERSRRLSGKRPSRDGAPRVCR